MNKENWKARLPLLLASFSLIITLYFLLFYSVRIARLIGTLYTGEEVSYLSWLVGNSDKVSLIGLALVGSAAIFGFLVSTRVKLFKNKWLRSISFLIAVLTILSGFSAYGMGRMQASVIPYFQNRLSNVIQTDAFVESILFEHAHGFYLMILVLPVLFVGFLLLFLMTEYATLDKELNQAFFKYEFKGKWLQRLGKMEEKEVWPDVELGLAVKSKEMVIMPGFDRTLNSLIVGGIGTGKTAALGLPILNQDLHHMTRYINMFPALQQREDFLTKDGMGRHLTGISVIEPSNDLCQKTLQLVKAHGIPDEAITYINPLDKNTPSINPMRGPVDKVAEVFAQVLAGLNNSGASGNFFFEQAQRNHLKQHIYLLKLHRPEEEVTFDMLLDMYNNPNLVHKMHVLLKGTIPAGIDQIEDKEERNYWKIIQGIDEWFDLTIIRKKERGTQGEQIQTDKLTGEVQYEDAKSEYVQGLRNILNDIGSNPLIRRVLFGHSDFDFDEHLANGGVLLVNTAKGELVDLARVLGKIVLMNLQNATFRRDSEISPFHHIMVDEAPDYFYDGFREFPVQSRKYKVILTTIMQTIAQLADQFGEHYMTTIIAGMRNRMVYGDVPAFDANYFSEMFGEKYIYDEGQSEMSVSPLQDSPITRGGSSYAKVREQAMTSGDIMFQDAFNCAVKIVVKNQPTPVQQIKANFVPAAEFKEATVIVKEQGLAEWLSYRKGDIPIVTLNKEIEVIEDKEAELLDMRQTLEQEQREKEAATPVEDEMIIISNSPRPTKPIYFEPGASGPSGQPPKPVSPVTATAIAERQEPEKTLDEAEDAKQEAAKVFAEPAESIQSQQAVPPASDKVKENKPKQANVNEAKTAEEQKNVNQAQNVKKPNKLKSLGIIQQPPSEASEQTSATEEPKEEAKNPSGYEESKLTDDHVKFIGRLKDQM